MIISNHLELFLHAATRADMAAFLEAAGIAKVDQSTQELVPMTDVQIHPFRPTEEITVQHATGLKDIDGNPTFTTETGFRCNLRFYGAEAERLRNTLAGVATKWASASKLTITESVKTGHIPAGYQTAAGVTLFEPGAVTWRRNVWA